MTYDAWKLDNPYDEAERRIRSRRIICEDCDRRFATVCLEDFTGYRYADTYLCEECADKRQERELDDAAHDGDDE